MKRQSAIDRLKKESFDLLIIGGGITGAGLALDAASRGIKTALVEKEDYASGTSSKSTKLIHGGLRYLKQFNFGLVAKTGQERAIIHKIAPHLVLPDKMLLPFYDGGTFGKFSTRIGLFVYDTLAGVSGDDRYRILSADQTSSMIPLLKKEGLEGSGYYAEYRTDDARLTIENIKKAMVYDAVCANYSKCTGFTFDDSNRINGAVIKDEVSGGEFNLKAKIVVNAAGPWVDNVRSLDQKAYSGKKLVLSKGVHLVFDRSKLNLDHTVYFDKGDGRLLFAVPRNNTVYVGTTDTIHRDSPDLLTVTQSDVDYIMEAVDGKFNDVALTQDDILSTWVGVRPLISEEGKDVTEISRKDEIFVSDSNLITIAGGKLTGYRHMADDIIDQFLDDLVGTFKECRTDTIKLTSDPFKNHEEVASYLVQLKEKLEAHNQVPFWMAEYLVHNYGKASEIILKGDNNQSFSLDTITLSELYYCIDQEQVINLLDFYERRTGRLYFQIKSIPPTLEAVAERAAEQLGWTNERRLEEIAIIRSAITRQTLFAKG